MRLCKLFSKLHVFFVLEQLMTEPEKTEVKQLEKKQNKEG